MGDEALQAVQDLVLADPGLTDELFALTDDDAFVARLLEVAHGHGVALTADQAEAALAAGQRRGIERWV